MGGQPTGTGTVGTAAMQALRPQPNTAAPAQNIAMTPRATQGPTPQWGNVIPNWSGGAGKGAPPQTQGPTTTPGAVLGGGGPIGAQASMAKPPGKGLPPGQGVGGVGPARQY